MSSHSSTLAQVMGPSLITIEGDASVERALKLARGHQVHHLPVLHRAELVGLICTCDLRDAPPESQVAQWMSQPPVTLDASATLHAAAQTMQDKQVGSVIVTLAGRARGIVTRGDLLQLEPSTESILRNGRCECCGLTRHLSTDRDGHTFCIYCQDQPGDAPRPIAEPEPQPQIVVPRPRLHEPHPLASLIRDHRLLGELAQALAGFSVCVEAQPTSYDRADLAIFARVFRELGDCMHHEKEEAILLPLLAHLGFDWENGPVAEVRQEHCQERYMTDVLCQAADREGEWDQEERRQVAATAFAMADFQRLHLLRENTQLFPVIMQRMKASELRLLAGELRTFDVRIDRHLPRVELVTLAKDVIGRYLAPPLASSSVVECGLSALAIG
jgi:CBS domain-containing protein/hemerythrin-like domain-containing protein